MNGSAPITSPLLSVEEAAGYLGMSVQWCYRALKRFVPHVKIGGALKFRKDDLDAHIERSAHPPLGFSSRDIKSSVSLGDTIRGNRLRSQEKGRNDSMLRLRHVLWGTISRGGWGEIIRCLKATAGVRGLAEPQRKDD